MLGRARGGSANCPCSPGAAPGDRRDREPAGEPDRPRWADEPAGFTSAARRETGAGGGRDSNPRGPRRPLAVFEKRTHPARVACHPVLKPGGRWWELIARIDQPGTIALRSRATDLAGRRQSEEQQWNRLGYGKKPCGQCRFESASRTPSVPSRRRTALAQADESGARRERGITT
jgi:hypothetical protein